MNLQEIQAAVNAGKVVHWGNEGYIVICDNKEQWLIQFIPNGNCIGLTWADGKTLNGEEEDFFISKSKN